MVFSYIIYKKCEHVTGSDMDFFQIFMAKRKNILLITCDSFPKYYFVFCLQ